MTDVLLFHHAQGLTDGIHAFADQLRAAGHGVIVPDLYDGATFATVEEGVAHAEQLGFDALVAAGVAAADPLPAAMVYAGFSLGALPAQKLAQTRSGALGAILYHGGVPVSTFGQTWPAGVELQVHNNRHDEWGELDIVEELMADVRLRAPAESFVYPGSGHLFTDASLADYEPDSAALVVERTLALLDRLG